MVSNDGNDRVRKVYRRQNVSSHAGMKFHFLEFSSCEWARLIQDVLRNGKLSHVMQQCGGLDRPYQRVVCYADFFGKGNSVSLNSSDVTMSYLVFGIYRHRKRFDGGHVESI